MRRLTLSTLFLIFCQWASAQLTLSNGNHVLEITGTVTSYYNQRFLKDGEEDQKKDRFKLRDAQLQFEGRIGHNYEYELQVDFVDLGSGVVDPENPGIMDAWLLYKGIPWFDIKVGYGKLPYSRSSLVPFIYSPYWQRSEIARGDIFARRDVGLTLQKSFWKQRINLYAGAFTGLGEISLRGDNDASGMPEFVGRADIAWPARYRYRDIDTRVTPLPMFALGVNGRIANKVLPEGEFFPAFSGGEYDLKVLDGRKYVYGMDFSFQYQGLSAQFEIHQLRGEPADSNNFQFRGFPESQTEGYFRAGGYYGQLSYFIKPLKTIVSGRFQELNLSDLAEGQQRRFSIALAYQLQGFNSMIKAQYFHVLEDEPAVDELSWNNQIRIGWQLTFR